MVALVVLFKYSCQLRFIVDFFLCLFLLVLFSHDQQRDLAGKSVSKITYGILCQLRR